MENKNYGLTITNNTNDLKKVFISATREHIETDNYGSDNGVIVATNSNNKNYLQFLLDWNENTLKAKMISLSSENENQIGQIIYIHSIGNNGNTCDIPLITQSYVNKNNKNKIDIHYPLNIGKMDYIYFQILPNTTLNIELYEESDYTKEKLDSYMKTKMSDDFLMGKIIEREYNKFNNSLPIQFDLYNANRKIIHVNPFSENFDEHSGAVKISKNEEPFESISLMRLQYNMDIFSFLTRPFYIGGEKVNISSYFSPNQYQSTILDIPIGCKLKDLNLQVPLGYMEHCTVTFFQGDTEHKIQEKGAYVVIHNPTTEDFNVNLIDLFKGINANEKMSISNNDFNEKRSDYNCLRVWTKNMNQFNNLITVNPKGLTIKPNDLISSMQWRNDMVDIYQNFNINEIESMETTIIAETKVMYHLI